MAALLVDLDGVVYAGDARIAGARDALAWIVAQEIPHLFLTNTTSRPRSALVGKLAAFGIDVDASQILTPPVAAAAWLADHVDGEIALFVPAATHSEFASLRVARDRDPAPTVAAVVVGDYGEHWTFAELNRAFRLLMSEPKPMLVGLGMTRYWLASDGLRLDAGPFVSALAFAADVEPVVLGKPAAPFFETALTLLGASASSTLMIGDDIRVDVGGAQACGLSGALVRTGKFRREDLDGDVDPDYVLDSIADLPARWPEIAAHLE
jgi:HAD superfamily hydrolase (TIGR01458 family)